MTSPKQAESLLDQAESALDLGDPESALGLCAQALSLVPDHPGAHFVRGDALRVLGDLEQAVDAYRRAALGRPDHASSWASLALTSFEMLDTAEARRASDRAIREDPSNPEGWWVRSLILEWSNRPHGARRCALHAAWLDHIGFPLPPTLDDDDIEALVEEALQLVHPTLQAYLANVVIVLDDVPDDEVLRSYDPPASPLGLLGYFSGHSLMERSTEDPWSMMPSTIVLYRKNLERHARDRDELIEQLQLTLFHEMGHFLGLDEEDLEARGLD